jgi:hypothetical protein
MRIITAAVALAIAALDPAQAQVTVVEGARVITGDERTPIENASIVVDGARIAWWWPA